MFGSSAGSSSLFGGGQNTSTPTSKGVQSDNNAFQPRQKTSSGGLFGDVSSGQVNGASTPSPSGGIFGSKNVGNGPQRATNNLFGGASNSATTSTTFGNNNNNTGNSNIGAPFASNINQSTFGSNNAGLIGQPNSSNNASASLFGNSSGTSQQLGATGGLFGNSGNTASNGGLFSTTATNGNSGGLFSNRSPAAGIGSGSTGTAMSGGMLFPGSTSQSNQISAPLSANPYGLQINSMSSNVANMPESITSSVLKRSSPPKTEKVKEKAQSSSFSSPNTSIPSNFKSNTTLIGKLSSRLKSSRSIEPTQGLFSPARKPMFRQEDMEKLGKDHASSEVLPIRKIVDNHSQTSRTDVSELRRLKIDTGRSAAKKIKLFNGMSEATSMKVLGEKEFEPKRDELKTDIKKPNELHFEARLPRENEFGEQNDIKSKGYWCSPTIDQLSKLPIKQLCSVSNFVVGRRGFGSISFDSDVDLSSFIDDLEDNLFDKTVIFHGNKTVEVYPDSVTKPPFGYGLNVPATITLEKIYAIDQRSRAPIEDHSAEEVQLLIKKLRRLKGMTFISYNPFEGLWTFKVQHFSVWGLVDGQEDNAADSAKLEKSRPVERKLAFPKLKSSVTQLPTSMAQQSAKSSVLHANGLDIIGSNEVSYPRFESEDAEMFDLIDEKQYEPSDVSVNDFIGLEPQSTLSVSSDWVSQLKLAGESYNSIFKNSSKSGVHDEESEALFPSLDANIKTRKDIRRTQRVLAPPPFAKFSNDSNLLLRSLESPSGCSLKSSMPYELDIKTRISRTFESCFPQAQIEARETNGYPVVKDWAVTIESIGRLLGVGEERRLWELISILFDECPTAQDDGRLEETKRYKRLCNWVVEKVKPNVLDRINLSTCSNEKIFNQILIGDIIEATELAMKTRNPHLAVLITLLGSNNSNVKSLACQQLLKWKALNKKVEPFVVKTYQLLGGALFDHQSLIDIENQYSWLECLSMWLSYGNTDSKPLTEVLSSFLRKPFMGSIPRTDNSTCSILEFFSSKEGDEKLLENISISSDVFRCRDTWFMTQALRSKDNCNFSTEKLDRITSQFFEQLAANRLFSEALFTLMFLNNDDLVKQKIDSLISRHIQFFTETSNRKALDNFKIPKDIFFKARALHHKYNEQYLAEAENLLDGGLIDEAAKSLSLNVGPELVLRGSRDTKSLITLRNLIQRALSGNVTSARKDLVLFQDYAQFVLDSDTNLTRLERIIRTLPAYYAEQGHLRKISICCSIISNNVALAYLEKHEDKLASDATKKQLLVLPFGEPELQYIKKKSTFPGQHDRSLFYTYSI
ncbi:LANO_0F01046g1_1 [Lachancea nothofagi CBS 11611]|uniref:LANO_0F01046g1_1 n=1 Tax=Lachancea nothofagi CBS 11611 TaxID=1266666 RepID=A0A1G4K5T2_9SACH|nr:LANO_0F01046g1_1 [Lachancea nothofagi CBS 11611]